MMTTATEKTPSPPSRQPGTMKSRPVAIAKVAMVKPLKTQPAAFSRVEIETKAYGIWMARGQEQGQDQEHWFEAERQLRQE